MSGRTMLHILGLWMKRGDFALAHELGIARPTAFVLRQMLPLFEIAGQPYPNLDQDTVRGARVILEACVQTRRLAQIPANTRDYEILWELARLPVSVMEGPRTRLRSTLTPPQKRAVRRIALWADRLASVCIPQEEDPFQRKFAKYLLITSGGVADYLGLG